MKRTSIYCAISGQPSATTGGSISTARAGIFCADIHAPPAVRQLPPPSQDRVSHTPPSLKARGGPLLTATLFLPKHRACSISSPCQGWGTFHAPNPSALARPQTRWPWQNIITMASEPERLCSPKQLSVIANHIQCAAPRCSSVRRHSKQQRLSLAHEPADDLVEGRTRSTSGKRGTWGVSAAET